MFALDAIQAALREFGFDAWLLYDFRGRNTTARAVLDMQEMIPGSRRFFYLVPANGEPRKLVHRIEQGAIDHLPGNKHVYLRWQELEAGVKEILSGCKRVAMEYSPRNANPYVSVVDGGTVELVKSSGVEVVPSGDLIQLFEATWDDAQWEMHLEADGHCQAAFELAWKMIAEAVRAGKPRREVEVQRAIMDHFASHGMTTYHPPIVGVGPHGGDPHYEPSPGSDADVAEGELVLVDLWAKMDRPRAVYSDITKMGFVGETVPEKYTKIFDIVAAARDAGVACVRDAFAAGRPVRGYEVDDATRKVITDAGYGADFVHRTGHSIGEETHGNGTHMDNLETHDDRLILRRTCFSIEPGIYKPEFGVRCEVDVYIDGDGGVHVTGGVQDRVLPILAEY
ncbi:MAG: M24 family metallopeptidase [Gemmatimonadota bacterium]|nr:M24 family metallopeptidase [Gemmatimonadota bacterium]